MTKIDLMDELDAVRSAYEALALMACESSPCLSTDVGEVLSVLNQSFEHLSKHIDSDCPNF
jgi:hypothetical protein